MNAKVWVIRGYSKRRENSWDETENFINGGYVGIGYGLQDVNLAIISDRDELNSACRRKISGASQGAVTANLNRVSTFLFEMRSGDHVILPLPRGGSVRYGMIASEPYHANSGNMRNRLKVDWRDEVLNRNELFSLAGGYRPTIAEVKNTSHRSAFFDAIG